MIRPIEMQMLLPRTESVGNVRQFENQRVLNDNAFAGNQVAKEIKHNSEIVIPKDANEFAEYKYDAKEKGNGTYQNPKKQKKGQEKEKGNADRDKVEIEMVIDDKQPRVNIQI